METVIIGLTEEKGHEMANYIYIKSQATRLSKEHNIPFPEAEKLIRQHVKFKDESGAKQKQAG